MTERRRGGAGVCPPSGAPRPSRARVMLRRLAAVAGEGDDLQARLDRVTAAVAGEMVAEVCSIYALRAGGSLELFATHGLAPQAVHHLRMSMGEGLVGLIAQTGEPLDAPDAQAHPRFSYKPETGEEAYSSFVGVPILHGGGVIGVLTVQNVRPIAYEEEDIEALQVVAALIAEMMASAGPRAGGGFVAGRAPRRLEGRAFVRGVAIGRAWLHEPRVSVRRILADDPATERRRLDEAAAELKRSVDAMLGRAELRGGAPREVLETYRMFADDRKWLERMREAIESGLSAEAAVRKVQDETRVRLETVEDRVIRESLFDLDDLANRLMAHLAGRNSAHNASALPDGAIVVARSLGPAELVEYDREKLRAVVVELGSATAHMSIVARAFGIPVIGRIARAMSLVEGGDRIVVDADNDQAFLRPNDEVWDSFARVVEDRAAKSAVFAAERDLPAVTRDGVEITLETNAAFLVDLPRMLAVGAGGVGLFRTELAFMARSTYPLVQEQRALYAQVIEQARGRPVTFRTLDIGGDKRAAFIRQPDEENPAMGWRALRMTLDRSAILRDQLRALIGAASGGPLRVMFPMVATVGEFEAAKRILDCETARARTRGAPVGRVEVGAMIETPAILWDLERLLARVDFACLGTNDLLQFAFASDRGSPEMARRYDALHPSALAIVGEVLRRCADARVPLTVCGEMAGRPLDAIALVGLGARRLSVDAGAIGAVKSAIRSLNLGHFTEFLKEASARRPQALRSQLHDWARDHGLSVVDDILTF